MTSNESDTRSSSGAWFDEEAFESGRVRVHPLPPRAQPVPPEYEVYVTGESVAMGGDRCLLPADSQRRDDTAATPSER